MKLSTILSKLNPKMKLMTTSGSIETSAALAESAAAGYDPDVAVDSFHAGLFGEALLITSERGGRHPWFAEVVDNDGTTARAVLGLKTYSRYTVTVVSGSVRNATRAAKVARSLKAASDFRSSNFPTSTSLTFTFTMTYADDTYGYAAKRDAASYASIFSPSSVSVVAIIDDVVAR